VTWEIDYDSKEGKLCGVGKKDTWISGVQHCLSLFAFDDLK